MTDAIEMVYSACADWLADWAEANTPLLLDELDVSQWMDTEMRDATDVFIQYGLHSSRARNDAIMILRALYYEYYLFQRQNYIQNIQPDSAAVLRLPMLPQSNQKSAAWHAESREMLSGHEFGSVAVGSVAERAAVIAKKCAQPVTVCAAEDEGEVESRTVYLTGETGLSAFKWGWRYEPVARDVFERCVAEGTVFDGLGRIRHPTLPRLGASPDGLIMTGPRRGRLVEIKCPPTRIITGSIPIRYYCQMQLQAEVCDVDAVEYVELQFSAVQQADATEAMFTGASKVPWIGKICVTAENEETAPSHYKYAYSPLFPATADGYRECSSWHPFVSSAAEGLVLESSMWWVKDWFATTVPRNRQWFADVGKPAYEAFWVDVEAARADGRYKPRLILAEEDSDEEKVDTKISAWIGVDSD
jgi:hypothetical protein